MVLSLFGKCNARHALLLLLLLLLLQLSSPPPSAAAAAAAAAAATFVMRFSATNTFFHPLVQTKASGGRASMNE